MKLLIIGITGMLGHKLWQRYRQTPHEVYGTLRTLPPPEAYDGLYEDTAHIFPNVDAQHLEVLLDIVRQVRPDVIINCVGLIKQHRAAKDPLSSLQLNALLPHRLALVSQTIGARLIHISTDCVFNGDQGHYTEDTPSDAQDLYGRTKFLGEVSGEGLLTLRTSIIGRELRGTSGLIEWFLSHRPHRQVRGFRRAIYSGFSTLAFSDLLLTILEDHPHLEGVYHVSSDPIDKYSLLVMANQAYEAGITIVLDETVVIDRSLVSARFRQSTGWAPPAWSTMVAAMAADGTPYDEWRK